MKKILCFFTVLTLVLSSCSSDDDGRDTVPVTEIITKPITEPIIEPKKENQFLPKKTIRTDEDGLILTTIYTYNGNKIISGIEDSGEGIHYIYTGDLITKLEYILANGTVEQVDSYEYDSKGKLTTFKRIDPIENLGNKEVYTYNADGSVAVVEYIGDSKTQTRENATSIITFLNGEVSEITSTNSPNFKYTYDTKNNPIKNILGMDKITFTDGEASGIFHNIISEISVYGNATTTRTAKITYNVDGYPEKSVDDFEGKVTTTEYFYE